MPPRQAPLPPSPVEREVVYRSDLVTIRDNICTRRDPSLSAPREPMPFHEVCFGRQGAWVRHVAGRALVVDAGSVHFLNRGEVHRVSHPYGCHDRNTGLELSDAALVDVAPRDDGQPFERTDAPLDLAVSALHQLVLAAARRARGPSLALDELVLVLVRRALRSPAPAGRPARPGPTARRHAALALDARALIAAHGTEALTLAAIAAALGASPFHLARVFRAQTGTSLHRALLAARLRAALPRITDGDEPLADVAAATGFADRSHLSRSFAAAFGLSPAAFRREGSLDLARRLARGLGD